MSMTYSNFEPPVYSDQEDAAAGMETTTAATPTMKSYPTEKIDDLSIALLGPNEIGRNTVARALVDECAGAFIQQFSDYPDISDLSALHLYDDEYDIVVIELDGDADCALSLVESICSHSKATVMVYSIEADPEMLMRCMRAGAREFLALPFKPDVVHDALVRATTRRAKPVVARTVRSGKLLVFMGAKGGVGVTSLACNFAVALATDTRQKTVLIDLDLPLGDAALNLGVVSEFSTITALDGADRLDGSFFSTLLVEHSSGLWVLGAPGRFPHYEPTNDAIERLLAIARQEFDNVVVDLGSRLDPQGTSLCSAASTVYLVTQSGIPELRNANRLISQITAGNGPNLEIVVNRFESRTLGVSEEHITKALTKPINWKIPNDHALVRKMQIDAIPLVLSDNPLSRIIRQMADAVLGKQVVQEKKKRFGLFG